MGHVAGGVRRSRRSVCVSVDVVRDVTHMEAVARVALCAAPALVGRVFIAANVIAAVYEVVARVAHPFVGAKGVVGVGLHLQVQERVVTTADHAVRQGRRPLLSSHENYTHTSYNCIPQIYSVLFCLSERNTLLC
jgi:hypothetical protein